MTVGQFEIPGYTSTYGAVVVCYMIVGGCIPGFVEAIKIVRREGSTIFHKRLYVP